MPGWRDAITTPKPHTGMLPKLPGDGNNLPVLQEIAGHRVGDVIGREGEALDLDQQRVVR